MGQLYSKKGGERVLIFVQPQKLLATIGYHPNIHIFINWATHEVPPWTIVWMLFFNQGLYKASNYLETCIWKLEFKQNKNKNKNEKKMNNIFF